MRTLLITSAIFFSLSAGAQSGAEADKILGEWMTEEGKAKVQVYKCGEKYCGKIVWLRDPLNDEGKPKVDKNNPDDKLKSKPIMGLNLLKDFEYEGDYEWEEGEIYDPDNGKTYSCVINMDEDNPDVLDVRGYIGFSLIGRTTVWKRVE